MSCIKDLLSAHLKCLSHLHLQSDLYYIYPRYLGVINFGLKSKTAYNKGLTVSVSVPCSVSIAHDVEDKK